MKRLAVLRHAKSRWGNSNIDDFDRLLNERGWKAARRMGRELRQRKLRFDLALASPAARVRETLDGLAEGYGVLPFAVHFEPCIYLADSATLLELVRAFSEEIEQPLIVGHNPGIQRLILQLARDDAKGLRRRVEGKYPTAALALIDLSADRWADVAPASGTMVELILPKELD
jgi:phosphohistidine phosphatase